jgi:hypothetical protein
MWTVNGERKTDDGRQVIAKAHFALSTRVKKGLSRSREIDKFIRLTENNCLQCMIPETNMTLGICVYK